MDPKATSLLLERTAYVSEQNRNPTERTPFLFPFSIRCQQAQAPDTYRGFAEACLRASGTERGRAFGGKWRVLTAGRNLPLYNPLAACPGPLQPPQHNLPCVVMNLSLDFCRESHGHGHLYRNAPSPRVRNLGIKPVSDLLLGFGLTQPWCRTTVTALPESPESPVVPGNPTVGVASGFCAMSSRVPSPHPTFLKCVCIS